MENRLPRYLLLAVPHPHLLNGMTHRFTHSLPVITPELIKELCPLSSLDPCKQQSRAGAFYRRIVEFKERGRIQAGRAGQRIMGTRMLCQEGFLFCIMNLWQGNLIK